jgi:Cdc25 family phosphatase
VLTPSRVPSQDFEDGHIQGAVNWESTRWSEVAAIDNLIDQHLQDKERVVVHCAFSQQRGPRCADKLVNRLQERGLQQPAVLLMNGGFNRFWRLFGEDRSLVQPGLLAQDSQH